MINVTADAVTVMGNHEMKVFQLGKLIQYYLDNDITVLNDVISLLSENVDIKFEDCFFHSYNMEVKNNDSV